MLFGDLSTVLQVNTFKMLLLFLLGLLSFLPCCLGATTTHDETFIPDAVLIYTTENITQTSCVAEKATVLINGTSPGPELRVKEGQTAWIRVYNNIADQNVTVVSLSFGTFRSWVLQDSW